jgi:hypothetical protein
MPNAYRRATGIALCVAAFAAPAAHAQQTSTMFRALPDVVPTEEAFVSVDVTDNDVHDPWGNAEVAVTVLGTQQGLDARLRDGSAKVIEVTAPPDWFGTEVVSYRVCETGAGGRCAESTLTVHFGALRITHNSYGATGRANGYFWREPASPMTAEFRLTPRVPVERTYREIGVDLTPDTPWDNERQGTHVVFGDVPATGAGSVEWRIYARRGTSEEHYYVGLDDDGDGVPEPEEVRCVSAAGARTQVAAPCIVPVIHPGGRELRYWVLGHNVPYRFSTLWFEHAIVPMIDGDDDAISVGGVGIYDEPMTGVGDFRVTWEDRSMMPDEPQVAFVGTRPRPGAGFDWTPLPLEAGFAEPLALASGKSVTLGITGKSNTYDSRHRQVFIDVPAGATRLEVTMQSPDEVDLYLWRLEDPDADPRIEHAPDPEESDDFDATAVAPGGDATLVVEGTDLAPGRWYVVPWSRVWNAVATVTLEAKVTAVAPVVRPGSYFNAARPGHGLLLYPAADQLAGLWYTYDSTGPTWYYLQGAKPGADGIWHAGLYRARRGLSSRELARVGRATITPGAPDAFAFTFLLDGETGSEPMAALGRGCPTLGGGVVDASSHWFNPQTDGTGHSVQLWPDYEFYASFVYDDRGLPRFLTAESTAFAGASATLQVDQLSGFCPLCWYSPVERRAVGTMTRTYSGGTLSSISLQAAYARGLPGGWNQSDALQPLGGPGTTQGCAP